MTINVNRNTRLEAIMIGRCQGDDIFVAFQPIGIFRFWGTGNSLFCKDVHSPSRFALASSSLAALFPRSTIEDKYEKIEGSEQSMDVAGIRHNLLKGSCSWKPYVSYSLEYLYIFSLTNLS